MTERSKKKFPCGKCGEECTNKSTTSLPCGFCETWTHAKCIEGMTPEFLDTCDKINKLFGGSAFLCVICRKLAAKVNKSMKEVEQRMTELENRLKTAELERNALAAKIERIEGKADQVKEKVVVIEKDIESGMEKAMIDAKEGMTAEMKEREERSGNLVVYGMPESEKVDAEERKREDEEKVQQMARVVGVEEEVRVEVKFRAGKKKEGGKPRPLILKLEDGEARERMLRNARELGRKEEWRKVFLGPDLTFKQREEAREEDKKLREEAERRSEEAKNEGRMGGRYVVVGQRGRRRVVWWEERGRRD